MIRIMLRRITVEAGSKATESSGHVAATASANKHHEAQTSMVMLDQFISINKRVVEAITPTHVHEANVFGMHKKLGVMLMSHPRISTVVDVGAGKSWKFDITRNGSIFILLAWILMHLRC